MVFPRSTRGKLVLVVGIFLFVCAILLLMPNLNDDDVLVPEHIDSIEPDAPVIIMSLHPSEPVVMEGDSFQITCQVTGADRVFIELPHLSPDLRSSIKYNAQGGQVVLSFSKVKRGHQARYICHGVGRGGTERRGNVDVIVLQRDKSNLIQDVGEEVGEGRKGEREDVIRNEAPSFQTMEDRAKYQREQVDAFCKRHNLDDIKYQLPIPVIDSYGKDNEWYSYNRHMLLDDKHQILFCFVPKIGCTNLKLLVFVSQGIIPRSELNKPRDAVNQRNLEGAMFRNSFISMKHKKKKQLALNSYYKFTMFRNPLERLASSYRSKVERFPLVGKSIVIPHFNWLRMDIYSSQRPQEYALWKKHGGKQPVNISFSDFADYWVSHKIINRVDGYLDEHFLLISEMCQPCRTRFDFYGNFRHFERDAEVLVQRIGAESSDLRQSYYSEDTSTEERMKHYYSTLSDEQKRALLSKMALELEFHYTIFPEERDSHKQIMGIDIELPLT